MVWSSTSALHDQLRWQICWFCFKGCERAVGLRGRNKFGPLAPDWGGGAWSTIKPATPLVRLQCWIWSLKVKRHVHMSGSDAARLLKVTRVHGKWRGSIENTWLPILYHFRDMRRYWSRFANFSTLYLTFPLRASRRNSLTPVRLRKLQWTCQKVWWYVHLFSNNTATMRTQIFTGLFI